MNLYLSGPQRSWRAELEGHHLLVSYAEPRQTALLTEGWDVPGWLVDSGAFTCWTKGRPVVLSAYVDFLIDLEARAAAGELVLDGYLALDVIPGAPGRMPTADEAQTATIESMANLMTMRAAGLNPIPIYHEGEPMSVLDTYVAEGHKVIALGATASRGQACVIDWLIPIFERHKDQRFHGLAMTQARLLRSLPFDSVDSTSWLNPCRYGLTANRYLIKGRSPAFWKDLGYDFQPACLDTAAAALAERGKEVLRRVGIGALLDVWRCPPGSPITRDGQMLITASTLLGGVPKAPAQRARASVRTAPPPGRPTRHVPGQMPLFRRRRAA